jgi:cell division protein FtsA
MGIFKLFKGSDLSKHAIALDIGTEFVKALIFKVEDDHASVLGYGRQRQRLSDMSAGVVTDIGGVIKNCEVALDRAAEQAKIMPDQAIIGIAGELVKGTTTVIKYTRPDAKQNIAMPELRDIISRVQRRAYDQARSILTWESGLAELDVRLVNAAVVDVRIDGYKVTNPIGFQGKQIEISLYNSFAPIVHLGALQTIADHLDLDLLSITAEPYAVARSVSGEGNSDFSAIFIDIGGGTTDIAIVNSGGLVGTKMFAIGGRAFTKRIAQVLGVPFSEAEEIKLKYSDNTLDDEREKQFSKAFETDCHVWLAGVELTLGEYTSIDTLPSKILLCGGGSKLKDIEKVLKTDWGKKLPFAKKPSIHFIEPKDISDIKDETDFLRDTADITPMALANVAMDLVGKPTVVDGVLTKIIKNLKS